MFLVMELCDKGGLDELLKKRVRFSEEVSIFQFYLYLKAYFPCRMRLDKLCENVGLGVQIFTLPVKHRNVFSTEMKEKRKTTTAP